MKKAQSQIITTVLIILLVLAAIVIVWQVVQNAVTTTSEEAEGTASCIGIGLEITEVTVNTGAGTVADPFNGAVIVKRSADKPAVESIDVTVVVGDTANSGAITALEILGSGTASGLDISTGDEIEVAALIDDFQCNPVDSTTA